MKRSPTLECGLLKFNNKSEWLQSFIVDQVLLPEKKTTYDYIQ